MAATILFGGASAVLVSPTFKLSGQVTVTATGLAVGDEVTFELVRLVPAAAPNCLPCDCPQLPPCVPMVVGQTAQLRCFDGSAIKLTSLHPSVIIDSPIDADIRAVFSGANVLGIHVSFSRTNTQNVTDALRGCHNCCPATSGPAGADGVDGVDGTDGLDGATPTAADILLAVNSSLIDIFANDGTTVLFRAFPPLPVEPPQSSIF